MANYVPTMTKQDLLELREILKKTIQEDLEKYGEVTIGAVSTCAELEEVEERLKEITKKEEERLKELV